MTESKVCRSQRSFEGPGKLLRMHLNLACGPEWHTIFTPVVLLELPCWSVIEVGLAVWISGIYVEEFTQIGSEHSIFARFTVVEQPNQMIVPVFGKAMATVNLQLVGLITVLLLQKIAGKVVIFDISKRLDHVNGWSVGQTFYFFNVSSEVHQMLHFGVILHINIVQNGYMESFGMLS